MAKYSVDIFIEPPKKDGLGTRCIFGKKVEAEDERQAKEFVERLWKPLLKDDVSLSILVKDKEE